MKTVIEISYLRGGFMKLIVCRTILVCFGAIITPGIDSTTPLDHLEIKNYSKSRSELGDTAPQSLRLLYFLDFPIVN